MIDDLKRIGIIKTNSQVAFAHTLADIIQRNLLQYHISLLLKV